MDIWTAIQITKGLLEDNNDPKNTMHQVLSPVQVKALKALIKVASK